MELHVSSSGHRTARGPGLRSAFTDCLKAAGTAALATFATTLAGCLASGGNGDTQKYSPGDRERC